MGKEARDQAKKDAEQASRDQKQAAEEAAREAEQAAKDARASKDAAADFFWKAGMMDPGKYIGNMREAQGEVAAYSAEWWQLAQQIQDVNEELFSDSSAANDYFRNNDMMGDAQYLRHLSDRLNHERKYSAAWWGIQEEIQSEKEKIKERDEAIQDAAYQYGVGSLSDRKAQLEKRAKQEKVFSKEWWAIASEIQKVQDAGAERRNKYGDNFNDGQYVTWLKGQLAKTEKFSDRWDELMDKIASIEGTAFDKASGGFFEKFGDAKYMSAGSAMRWLQREIQQANEWAGIMSQLKSSGKYGEGVINRLQSMGPSSIGLARALMGAAKDGTSAQFNNLFQQAQNLGLNALSAGGVGGNMVANGFRAPVAAQGKMQAATTVINLTMPNATITSSADADRLANQLSFSINAARI
jgi:hypothetical protein